MSLKDVQILKRVGIWAVCIAAGLSAYGLGLYQGSQFRMQRTIASLQKTRPMNLIPLAPSAAVAPVPAAQPEPKKKAQTTKDPKDSKAVAAAVKPPSEDPKKPAVVVKKEAKVEVAVESETETDDLNSATITVEKPSLQEPVKAREPAKAPTVGVKTPATAEGAAETSSETVEPSEPQPSATSGSPSNTESPSTHSE